MSTKPVMDTSSTGRRRNRSWSEALKRGIVAASFEPGYSVSVVARRYDVNANQLFKWRKAFRDSLPGRPPDPATPQLVPVVVWPEQPEEVTPQSAMPMVAIEIDVADKYRLRVGSGVDAGALQLVLGVLERQ
ncbi:transposase [Rhodospirillaceae bacterium LM-1]|nr:transposase [Rhodospirillaceae bacterium LM-1]